ncbi:MAG: hypothetical protein EZS28_054005, partial [Streblomastix strix]
NSREPFHENDKIGKERRSIRNGQQDEEERSKTTTRRDWMFPSETEDEGDRLFRSTLIDNGISVDAINIIIANWEEAYRRHCKRLEEFAGYLNENKLSLQELPTQKGPQTVIINFLAHKLKSKHSDASVKAARTALSVLFSFMGFQDSQIHTPAITQLMKGVEQRTRKVKQEEQMWDLNLLWKLIMS